ncbi:MAG: hypothetical protein ABNH15_05785 [Alcanivorax sp.]|jgi:hypothetical protein
MYAYQLKNRPEEYKVIVASSYYLSKELGLGIRSFQAKLASDEPLIDIWKLVDITPEKHFPTAECLPDVSVWGNGWLVFSSEAREKLAKYLIDAGEFLPIAVEGSKMFVFHCTVWGKEDKAECITHYIDGEADGLDYLTFDQVDIQAKLLFKSKLQGGSALYCSSSFKALCHELELNGLRYDENLINSF